MKPKLLFFTSLLFCFTAFLQAQTDGTLTLTFNHVNQGTSKNVSASWIETSTGTFTKTRFRYVGSGTKDHLPAFAVSAGGSLSNALGSGVNITDALTGATRTSSTTPKAWETYTVVWDARDVSGSIVADGDYTIYVESAWSDNANNESDELIGFTFTKGAAAQSLTPAGDAVVSSVTLDWAPVAALGLDDNTLANNRILVYPNPSNGIIHINFKNTLVNKIQVFDVLGRTVYQELLDTSSLESAKTLDLSNNTKGIYILKFYSDKGTSSHKVLIGN
jgi:hypothetical protein